MASVRAREVTQGAKFMPQLLELDLNRGVVHAPALSGSRRTHVAGVGPRLNAFGCPVTRRTWYSQQANYVTPWNWVAKLAACSRTRSAVRATGVSTATPRDLFRGYQEVHRTDVRTRDSRPPVRAAADDSKRRQRPARSWLRCFTRFRRACATLGSSAPDFSRSGAAHSLACGLPRLAQARPNRP